jgi:hypothetical protein
MRSHEEALKRIGRYLKGTINEGLVLRPSESLNIDCYVDADFAGLCPHEDNHDPTFVQSRTGFAICISNCPVIWSSKLQGDISTLTMEAENSALSSAMRDVLPLRDLLIPFAWRSGKSSYIFSNNNTRGQRMCSDLGQFGTWPHHTSVKTLCGYIASVQQQA